MNTKQIQSESGITHETRKRRECSLRNFLITLTLTLINRVYLDKKFSGKFPPFVVDIGLKSTTSTRQLLIKLEGSPESDTRRRPATVLIFCDNLIKRIRRLTISFTCILHKINQ